MLQEGPWALLGDTELAYRVCALVPAFACKLWSCLIVLTDQVRRNGALHADANGASVAGASRKELRKLEKGPRIEVRVVQPFIFNREAPEFVQTGTVTSDNGRPMEKHINFSSRTSAS